MYVCTVVLYVWEVHKSKGVSTRQHEHIEIYKEDKKQENVYKRE